MHSLTARSSSTKQGPSGSAEHASSGRKLRILHIGNGRAFKIRTIIDAQLARGHEVHMVPIPPIPGAFPGVHWHCLPDSPLPHQGKVLHRMMKVRRLVNTLRPDVVHAHNAWGPGWYAAATGWHPYIIHAYGGDLLPEQYEGRPVIQRLLTSRACRGADRVIVTGQHMVDASKSLHLDPHKVLVLPRGVDLTRYRPGLDTTALRRQLQLDAAHPIVLSPRYQVDESLYNLDVVIDAFAELRRAFPNAVCIQLFERGRDRGVSMLADRAAERSLGDSYRLTQAVDNTTMPLFYNLADITVSVPSSDGFPVTVLEASACECPLIVSDLPYCREWFVARENGILVPPRDASELRRAMVELSGNPELCRRIGGAGRGLVKERADYVQCMATLERLYLTLASGSKSSLGESD